MIYNPDQHHRRSIRVKDYDYSSVGAYFVTICTQRRECLFGEVMNGEMVLNDAGRMVEQAIHEIPHHCPGTQVDAFIAMPNHVHIVLFLDDCRGTSPWVPQNNPDIQNDKGGHGDPPLRLSDVVERFKSWTTHQYITGVKQYDWAAFHKRLWQRNYYERILRDERELDIRRQYIENNPIDWAHDEYNPMNQNSVVSVLETTQEK